MEHTLNDKIYPVSWAEITGRVRYFDKSLKYYGVPRGGQYIAAMLNPVDTPEEADVIIDDLIDSGETMNKYREQYPDKPFVGLFSKDEINLAGKWLVFPWEQKNESDVETNVQRLLQYFDDASREGLRDTPRRYVKFLKQFLTPDKFEFTTFESEGYDAMICVKNIPFFSLCEHHLAPFFGTASIAYIPNPETKRIVGLSKLPRTLEMFARRFQNQERITTQVAEFIQSQLNPLGVAVQLTARHLCVEMRGVKKHNCETVTTKLLGAFKEESTARNEFFHAIKSAG